MKQFGNTDITDAAAFESVPGRGPQSRVQADSPRRGSGSTPRTPRERLGEIVERHGWPTFTLVGKDGAKAAWLLVQHADLSPKFQRKCLDLMTKCTRDEIFPDDLAYLTDRVLLAEGKNQVYGTQFTMANGKCKPRPLEDEANVDQTEERRRPAAAGGVSQAG